jgi:hypothetical protein
MTPSFAKERIAQRNAFAAAALTGILASGRVSTQSGDLPSIARQSFAIADEMMIRQERRP